MCLSREKEFVTLIFQNLVFNPLKSEVGSFIDIIQHLIVGSTLTCSCFPVSNFDLSNFRSAYAVFGILVCKLLYYDELCMGLIKYLR